MIAGQDILLERTFVALLARGHLLLEGVPGLAKTLTIKTTAAVLGGTFQRVQFTPDLVPSDLVGTRIYRPDRDEFDIELGPVFCNFLLADEINRAPAKVQSALLEVMQERHVTIGKQTFAVPSPFLVMATQNPIESEGTYALPEAQLDRFMLKVLVDYPDAADELVVIDRALAGAGRGRGGAVARASSRACRRRSRASTSTRRSSGTRSGSPAATRDLERVGLAELAAYVEYGVSPRGPINLALAARALARAPRPPLRRRRRPARTDEGRLPAPDRAQLRGARRRRRPPTTCSTACSPRCEMPDHEFVRQEVAS